MKNFYLLSSGKSWRKYFLITFFALIQFQIGTWAQDVTVKGTITDANDGTALLGVTIQVMESTIGTFSDEGGKYSINAKMGDVLQFKYLGMESQEVTVSKARVDVKMEVSALDLDEVVVIGYGTVKKKELTGAVSQIKGESLKKFNTSDLASALQGQISGVNVVAASGAPGDVASIQIRGVTSLNGSNTPLFVVDGIIQDGDPRLSRNEIETIDILKDAASASIYGTRGAAGVILITTKRGTGGKAKISFDQSYGIQKITSGTPLMNTADQIRFDTLKSTYVLGAPASIVERRPEWAENETNLDDFILADGASSQTYDLGITGGSRNFSYSVVGGYFNREGIIVNSGFSRYNARINAAYREGRWNMRAVVGLSTEENQRADGGLVLFGIRFKPYFPEIDINATRYDVSNGETRTATDFLLQRLKKQNTTNRDRINGSLNASYDLTKDLKFIANVGTGITTILGREFVPFYTTYDVDTEEEEIDPTKSYAEMNMSRARTYSVDASLNYKKKFGDHTLGALATVSVDERAYEYFEAGRQGVANNNISVINGATLNPYASSGLANRENYVVRTLGTLGRLQYNYKSRYLFSASVRRDGSSKFAPDNRWGIFPSVSAGWNISSEPFWKPLRKVTDNVKLRASYGTTGNESFPAYRYSTVIAQGADYVFGPGVNFGAVQRAFANAAVKWETSTQTNIGLDLGFWKNRLTFTADYYTTSKKDMLFPVELPPSAGALSGANADLILNVGDMTNKGLELAMNYRSKIGALKWNLGGVFTTNNNQITSINGATELIINSNSTSVVGDPASAVTAIALGHEVGAYFTYPTDGVINDEEELAIYQVTVPNAKLGDMKYIDTNGDSLITELDRIYSGSALPDFEFGINLSLEYKGFDFTMNWYGAIGHELVNGSKAFAYNYGRHQDLLNMWTPENPTSNIPIHRANGKEHPNYSGATDYWIEDGSYVRLRAIVLGYSLPQSLINRIGVTKTRLFVSAQNPLTFTNYSGYDPEVGGSVSTRGLDTGRYPMTSQYLFGVQLDF